MLESPASTSAVILFSRTMVNIDLFVIGRECFHKIDNSDKKLPSVYADLRGELAVDWIKRETAGATFCRRSDQVKEVKGGKIYVVDLNILI